MFIVSWILGIKVRLFVIIVNVKILSKDFSRGIW